jgi:hypothetical protein
MWNGFFRKLRKCLPAIRPNECSLGPRLEFAYPVLGKAAISGMPLLWDTGNLFSQEQLPYYLLDFQRQQPDLLIFLRRDYARMGPVAYYQYAPGQSAPSPGATLSRKTPIRKPRR